MFTSDGAFITTHHNCLGHLSVLLMLGYIYLSFSFSFSFSVGAVPHRQHGTRMALKVLQNYSEERGTGNFEKGGNEYLCFRLVRRSQEARKSFHPVVYLYKQK